MRLTTYLSPEASTPPVTLRHVLVCLTVSTPPFLTSTNRPILYLDDVKDMYKRLNGKVLDISSLGKQVAE